MSDWTQGYTTEIEYTYGYYSELNPQRIRLAFAYNGRPVTTRPDQHSVQVE